jgi:SAM-dependent methyltransferase
MMLQYSGEFVVPGNTPDHTYQEHLARYRFASTHVAGRCVLDIACGTGYGVAVLLHGGARSVVGVDRSPDALRFAAMHFGAPGAMFVRADIRAVPFPSGSFDVVTSFETIEHIDEHARFLAECRRLLRPGGLLICSSPNKRVYSLGRRVPFNPFHVREFTTADFRAMLEAGIGGPVRLFAQRTMGLKQRLIYELWYLDARIPALTSLLQRLRLQAETAPPPASSPKDFPEPDATYMVAPLASTLMKPATFLVAVCQRP